MILKENGRLEAGRVSPKLRRGPRIEVGNALERDKVPGKLRKIA